VAGLFHDIALKDDTNESIIQLPQNQADEFRLHPFVAAEMLKKIENVPPNTDAIVLEQHEVGPGQGFPKGLPYSRISPLGLLFSFSHFYVDYLIEYACATKALDQMQDVSKRAHQYQSYYRALMEMDIF
jgi:response regulator RpfG family c-di-GMP phosphodiesterase